MAIVKTKVGSEDIVIETGKLAKQADGSVTVTCGGTMVLVTCVCARQAKEDLGFFPLTVEYQEKNFAAGKIPGGFFKREGKPSEKEVLTSRMIDRPIRPLFPYGMLNEVQVIATVLSYDGKNDSDVLAMIGASAALHISNIPFDGPLAGVRVALIDGEPVINPTFMQLEESELELIVAANRDSVVMLEAGAARLSEEDVIRAIKAGHDAIKPLIDIQEQLRKEIGKTKRQDITMTKIDDEVTGRIRKKAIEAFKDIYKITDKHKRMDEMDILKKDIVAKEIESAGASADPKKVESTVKNSLGALEEEYFRDVVLKENRRVDGRKFDEIRKITAEIDVLPRTHGSGLFTRGETQALAVTTLGTSSDEQIIDALAGESYKNFMLHYDFPPFSVGEAKPMRGPGRREIGHGALAEKALRAVMPPKDGFPYTVRLVSEILESNGSSSMATVCAGSLSLMASGVPIE
ncbi:MAG: polyribonucleotide nucleotidyltransferase, partial [Candidatus Omnitrophica bacterium]|nr:polyribonucleotide nucleotidyltransferase [Candidatus Omnitrophota bacterium]